MTANTDVHTCSYYCERPECVRRQRDELRDRMESVLAKKPAAVDGAKETDLWRCTVCGRVGTVGRCCGEETREPFAPPSAPVEGEDIVVELERYADCPGSVEAVLRMFLTGDGYIAECDIPHIVAALAQQPAGRVHDLAARLVDELDGLVGESDGVSGLHLNGDVATWDELLPGGRFERLSSLDELRAALAAQRQENRNG